MCLTITITNSNCLVLKQDWYKRSNNYLTEAKKDNDFIYHERIPEVGKLAPVGKAAVVKATEVPDRFFAQVNIVIFFYSYYHHI